MSQTKTNFKPKGRHAPDNWKSNLFPPAKSPNHPCRLNKGNWGDPRDISSNRHGAMLQIILFDKRVITFSPSAVHRMIYTHDIATMVYWGRVSISTGSPRLRLPIYIWWFDKLSSSGNSWLHTRTSSYPRPWWITFTSRPCFNLI